MNQERVMIESVLKEEITKVNSENVDSIDVNEIDMDASLSEYCDSLDRVEVAINLEVRLKIHMDHS
jgi:acyl carrier protein